jgi:hypothetical protein
MSITANGRLPKFAGASSASSAASFTLAAAEVFCPYA